MNGRLFSFVCLQLVACSLWLSSCDTMDLYERVVPIPQHQWQSSYKPSFTFHIKDTAVTYQVFLIVRHNNQYRYNNIWVNLSAKGPVDSIQKFKLELPLANKEGWLGTGMDDIYEHRINITPANDNFYFRKSGEYVFTLEQVMREDPLQQVLDVGLRLEKKNP